MNSQLSENIRKSRTTHQSRMRLVRHRHIKIIIKVRRTLIQYQLHDPLQVDAHAVLPVKQGTRPLHDGNGRQRLRLQRLAGAQQRPPHAPQRLAVLRQGDQLPPRLAALEVGPGGAEAVDGVAEAGALGEPLGREDEVAHVQARHAVLAALHLGGEAVRDALGQRSGHRLGLAEEQETVAAGGQVVHLCVMDLFRPDIL